MDFNTPDATLVIPLTKKFPALKLTGTDGNAFSLMGKAIEHNRQHKIYSKSDMNAIITECTSGDYNHLLMTLVHFFKAK